MMTIWYFYLINQTLILVLAGEAPLPQATLVGHQEPLQCIGVSAELGLVFSGSEGRSALANFLVGVL